MEDGVSSGNNQEYFVSIVVAHFTSLWRNSNYQISLKVGIKAAAAAAYHTTEHLSWGLCSLTFGLHCELL